MTATGAVAGGSQQNVKSNSGSAGKVTEEDEIESTYHLKWIHWNNGKIPIVMQSINGPCPLIATMNVLLLREKVKLPTMLEQITANQLLTYLGECIMDCVPAEELQSDEIAILNLEQNIHDAMEIMPKLKTGLDVNIRFTGITDFEYTPECIIFDLLRIPLYHGWLPDSELTELKNAIGNQSYNQLVDNIITNKSSIEPEIMTKVLIAEEFLERTASQLTMFGLRELNSKIKDNEIGILFRNNHFLTLLKREGEIYTLVTDHGYLTEDNIIWETLDNIEGAGRFFDSNFQVSEITNRQVSEFNAIDQRQQQLENDFLMALSLREEGTALGQDNQQQDETMCHKTIDDFELAKQLQAQEDRYFDEIIREIAADPLLGQKERLVPSKNKRQINVPIDHFRLDNQEHLPGAYSSPTSASEVSSSVTTAKPADTTATIKTPTETRDELMSEEILDQQSNLATTAITSNTATDPANPRDTGAQEIHYNRANQNPESADHVAFPPLDSRNDQRPISSSSASRSSSSRRLKRDERSSNCIVS